MTILNHRLFSDNKSTLTHWVTYSGHRIPIDNLTDNHLAAIVDQYESEAVKVISRLFSPPPPKHWTEYQKRKNPTVQSFLWKNVPAWSALKLNQEKLRQTNYGKYHKLFIERNYEVKKEESTQYPFSAFLENLVGREVKIEVKKEPTKKQEYKPSREAHKARISLRITKLKIELEELRDIVNKEL